MAGGPGVPLCAWGPGSMGQGVGLGQAAWAQIPSRSPLLRPCRSLTTVHTRQAIKAPTPHGPCQPQRRTELRKGLARQAAPGG